MSTVISVYDNYGLVGRCDARCHESKKPQCKCICGGVHHGVGRTKDVDGSEILTDEQISENAKKLGIIGPVRVFRHAEQLKMFAE